MAKLTRKEREKLERQMSAPADRGATWVGCRPAVFKDKKRDIKNIRNESKALCRAYC